MYTLIKSMIKHGLLALALGICCAVIVMQHDTWVQNKIGAYVAKAFEQAGNCRFTGAVQSLKVLHPCIEFTDVVVYPAQGTAWSWQARTMKIGFSWSHLLLYAGLELHVEFDGLNGTSDLSNGSVAIMNHIYAFTQPASTEIPISLQSLSFYNSAITVTDVRNNAIIKLLWNSQSRPMANAFKSYAYILDGSLTRYDHVDIEKVRGNLQLDFYSNDSGTIQTYADINVAAQVPLLGAQGTSCFLSGIFNRQGGSFTFNNAERSIMLSPITIEKKDDKNGMHVQGVLPLESLVHVLTLSPSASQEFSGNCALQTDIDLDAGIEGMSVHLSVDHGSYGQMFDDMLLNVSCLHTRGTWHGNIAAEIKDRIHCDGSWAYDLQGAGFLELSNNQLVTIPGFKEWHVPPHKGTLKFVRNAQNILTGNCVCTADNSYTRDSVEFKSTLTAGAQNFECKAQLKDLEFDIAGAFQPSMRVHKALCKNHQNLTLMEFNTLPTDKDRLKGFVHMDLMRIVLFRALGFDLQGEGIFDVRMLFGDTVTTKIQLTQGTVRLPHTYNFINGLSGVIDVDVSRRALNLSGFSCLLHRGELVCDKATAVFDQAYNLSFLHVPLTMSHCLLNFNKDLFANVSGRAVLTKKEQELPHIKGQFILEQAQLKENILSNVFQKDVGSFASTLLVASNTDMACDITLATKEPLRVKTPFLDTKAKIDLHIKNTLRMPEVTGAIDLMSGAMHFPYKPLYITHGKISFLANQLKDPLIELAAKNKIKKYNISMNITGSLANHHIALQASPPLTQEQIVALLLTGTQQESLSVVMPALIMNNLTSLIFGREHDALNVGRYFQKFLKPLEHVHLIPSFSDQTARGGLRAALEIDINDRWHALLQKNFSLSEDTRVEVEYLLSDDISLRGIRDERRDLGGEVEMRWKF